MAMVISSNVTSLMAQTNLANTQTSLNKSIGRLSSGSRIISAQDDPAGLAISEKLKSQIRGVDMARRNAEDGISALQVAEGGMTEIGGILIRMKELALQASNETLSGNDRDFLNTEFQQLKSEITRISKSTKFNGNTLLSGAYSSGGTENGLLLQVGIDNVDADHMTVFIANVSLGALGSTAQTLTNMTISESAGQARNMLQYLDAAITDLSTARSQAGGQLARLSSIIRNLSVTSQNLTAANSRIRDVDVANETANLTRDQILTQAGVSVLSQANQAPQVALSLL